MAEANITTEVSIEAVLHGTFSKFVQEIYGQYGVQVTGVEFEWLERIDTRAQVLECRVHTKTNVGWCPKPPG